MFSESEIRKDAAARFHIGLMFYLGSAIVGILAGIVIIYTGNIHLDGTPSGPLLRATGAFLFAGISALIYVKGRNYLNKDLHDDSIDDIASSALFLSIMGIPFALGIGSLFFFTAYRHMKEPEPHGNICPYCGGYITLDPVTAEAYCVKCGHRF